MSIKEDHLNFKYCPCNHQLCMLGNILLTKVEGEKGTMFWDVMVKDSLEMEKEADLKMKGTCVMKKNCSKSHLIQKQSDEI